MRYLLFYCMLFFISVANAQSRKYAVGDTAFCGIVFFIDVDSIGRQHGLICSMEDQGTATRWNNGSYTITGAVRDGFFAKLNADKIIARQGGADSSYAAIVAGRYNPGGPNSNCGREWYLPSRTELQNIYQVLGKTKKSKFANEGYWTSLEEKTGKGSTSKIQKKAWIVDFLNGKSFPVNKVNRYRVRAIREFRS